MSLKSRKYLAFCAFLAAGTVFYACESSTDPEPVEDRILFDPALVELGDARAGTVEVINGGTRAIGPITLVPGTVTDVNGAQLGGQKTLRTSCSV